MKQCKCGVCGKTFRSRLSRGKHKREVHGGYFHNLTLKTKMERIVGKAEKAVADMKDKTLQFTAFKVIMKHLIDKESI